MNYVNFNFVVKNTSRINEIKDLTLIKGYHQIFEHEMNYGLHPDGFDDPESGWPEDVKPICAEMWRRVDDPDSRVNLEHMYYINKWFRTLTAESSSRARCS